MADKDKAVFLDASVLKGKKRDEEVKYALKMDAMRFEFPAGLNTDIPFIEELRALNNADDFDFMYDIAMQMLTGKRVKIMCKNVHDEYITVCDFIVTDRYMNLRGVPYIEQYPIVFIWLVDFLKNYLLKKYPPLS
jgi:hypothetical protein